MLITAIILFIIAAIFGLIVLSAILDEKPTPKLAVLAHGTIALTALGILMVHAIMGNTHPLFITSIVLFSLAACGGLTLFAIDMSKTPIPKLLLALHSIIAVFHPLVAVMALLILIVYTLQRSINF